VLNHGGTEGLNSPREFGVEISHPRSREPSRTNGRRAKRPRPSWRDLLDEDPVDGRARSGLAIAGALGAAAAGGGVAAGTTDRLTVYQLGPTPSYPTPVAGLPVSLPPPPLLGETGAALGRSGCTTDP
jgi:hypothetical protein